MNLNNLLKDELQYELRFRGIKSDAEIQTLRKLLRSAITESVVVNVNTLTRKDIPELLQAVVNKIVELRAVVELEHSDTPTVVA
jgi:hypothetical protein